MEAKLKELYYSPETGLKGSLALWRTAKAANLKVTKKFVTEWLAKQDVHQQHAKLKPVRDFFPIKAPTKDAEWCCDLVDVSRDDSKNSGVTYLLVVIDIYSRYLFVYPLKNKTAATVTEAMNKLISKDAAKQGHIKPRLLLSDNGSEFISTAFTNLCSSNNIEQQYAQVGDHHRLGIVDRVVRTLRNLIEKYKTAAKSDKYIAQLPKLVKNYNNSFHRSIGGTPASGGSETFIDSRIKTRELVAAKKLKDFKIGDSVKILNKKSLFTKSSKAVWSAKSFTIKLVSKNKRVYTLSNGKSYKYYQLSKVGKSEEHTYPVEQEEKKEPIIRKKSQRIALQKEGIDPDKDITTESKRVRIPRQFYNKLTGKYET
jgi:transposase InsO family protein